VNITIVGAGIVGCAIAHELASRGARVQLIDSRGVARGATRASAGILAPQIEGHIPQLRSLAACSLAMYDDFIRRVESDSHRSIEYSRRGTLQVALDTTDALALSRDAEALAANGVECRMLDAAEARRLEPALTRRVTAALLVPMHGCRGGSTHRSTRSGGPGPWRSIIDGGRARDRWWRKRRSCDDGSGDDRKRSGDHRVGKLACALASN
jgi:glycine/D-amino acid oxidase-like deaminating enzyme